MLHARVQGLVLRELGAVRLELRRGEPSRVGAEEEPEQPRVAQLGEIGRRLGGPLAQRPVALRRDAVAPPPTTARLAALAHVAARRESLRLGVERRVLHGPEVADAARQQLLEVVGRRLADGVEQAQDDVRGGGEARFGLH